MNFSDFAAIIRRIKNDAVELQNSLSSYSKAVKEGSIT